MCVFNQDTCQSLNDLWMLFLNNHTWIIFITTVLFFGLKAYNKKYGKEITDTQLINAYVYAVKTGRVK